VIDPGLGFGKRKEQNAEILAHLKQLAALDYPILVGPSRKSFLSQPSENATLFATAAAVTAAVLNGAHIVRVHDVKEMQAVIQMAEEIARAAAPKATPNQEDRPAVRPRSKTGPNFEAERPRPPRPPISRPPIAERPVEKPILRPAATEHPKERTPESRPPRAPYPARDKRDGSRPPVSRPFTPRRPAADKAGPPPRGRDFRPGQGPAKDRFNPKGPKRPFVRDADRPPRPGFKPPFKPSGPKRTFDRGGDSGPRSGPPRSGPPRSGPPQGGRPGSGPPKRPFRKRP
jgi:hypothetical protein